MKTPIQKIIFGSPGTGKSYLIDTKIIPSLNIDKDKNPENIIKTVFHPEYTYSDFIGKLLPITRSGKVVYSFYEGHFLRALGQAYKNYINVHDRKGKLLEGAIIENVVFVIDEINRGNSSSIFGAIFQLLDRDESGWSSYSITIDEVAFIKIVEIIEKELSYDILGNIKEIKKIQEKISPLMFDLVNRTIKIPPNLSIVATMNTSDSSIYYMDSAFKRRWDWEFIDIDSKSIAVDGIAFKNESEWVGFVGKLNEFIRSNHRYIRGIEDKQIGKYFIKGCPISKASIQSKLMFFLWDSVFSRDKKPLSNLLYLGDVDQSNKLVTFGDFAKQVDVFIEKIKKYNV